MPTQPNIVFIIADQLRSDFLGCYGAGFVQTPHIDALAAQGSRYERAYSISPICVPARASLLTGMNPIKTGVTSGGWMIYDGAWKLVKYANGDVHFFNRAEDPHEQHNLARDPAHAARYFEMDVRLTQEIMRSIVEANLEKSVDTGNGLWSDVEYGKEGYQRPYPFKFGEQ